MATGAVAGASISGGASLAVTDGVLLQPRLGPPAWLGAFLSRESQSLDLAGTMLFYEGALEARLRLQFLFGSMPMELHMRAM